MKTGKIETVLRIGERKRNRKMKAIAKGDELIVGNLVYIPVEEIKFDPEKNGRNGFPNLDQLKASIQQNGILQPVRVYVDGELQAGFSRVKAILDLKAEGVEVANTGYEVPALVVEKEADGPAGELHRLKLNLQTNVINPTTPMDVYANLEHLKELGVTDIEELKGIFHRSRAWIEIHQKLGTNLSPKLQKKVHTGDIPLSTAQKMVSLPKEEQEKLYEDLKSTGKPVTREAVADSVREAKGDDDKPFARTGAGVKKFFQSLSDQEEDYYGTGKAEMELSARVRALGSVVVKYFDGKPKSDGAFRKKLEDILTGKVG